MDGHSLPQTVQASPLALEETLTQLLPLPFSVLFFISHLSPPPLTYWDQTKMTQKMTSFAITQQEPLNKCQQILLSYSFLFSFFNGDLPLIIMTVTIRIRSGFFFFFFKPLSRNN